ncbi:AAA family ATPase [Deefgea piscis]|uniref:AAA family ATPase n=1 Tax=Deefgea piscis TaxID=2739061 RepID=UPI001C2D5607|nr:AAA family ATPase [Deefgea piscis]
MKTPNGQKVTKLRQFESLIQVPHEGGGLRLSSIGDVHGIENLGPRHPLAFGEGNLTVIYGHNGSGKSSYTRILKRAAGKARAGELKPNVFKAVPIEKKCTITYEFAGKCVTRDWHANSAVIDEIQALDVFDSDEATHYLRNESVASYTPHVVGMFEALATACDQIRALLQGEQTLLVSALPTLPIDYIATLEGRRYKALSADTAELALGQLLTWSEDDGRKLEEISERLKVIDPAAQAKQKRATKFQVERVTESMKQGELFFGLANQQVILELQVSAKSKRLIATEAAQVTSAQLEGVGIDTWREMWNAARVYSQTAYPDLAFPVTSDARCVLCHQELAPDAQQRLHDFEAFIQGQLESDANAAEASYTQCLVALPIIPTADQISTQCEAAGINTHEWVQNFNSFWQWASSVRSSLLAGDEVGEIQGWQDYSNVQRLLLAHTEQLESQALQFEIDAQGFDRTQALSEKLALEAKKWIAQQAGSVRNEIERLKQAKVLEDWKVLANSRPISIKAAAIAEKVITQAYVMRFNRELQLLGASRIQVEIVKARAEKGRVLHRLQLKAVQGKQSIELVLSEGERRIIALAAFLADVTDKPQPAPFIFDDPISSLDHDFEWSVASRLAELAKTRQVIVFTHRLSLYGTMEDVAKKVGEVWKKQHFQQLCIETYSGVAGHPVDNATWNAKTEKANNILLDRLGVAKKAGEAAGGDAYRNSAQGICSDFRKLLERTVEDDLLNEVVKRHRRSITTDNRMGVLAKIEHADCQFIDNLMTKYSCYEHSQSQEVPNFIPEEPELRKDIESLKVWRTEFKTRPKCETVMI